MGEGEGSDYFGGSGNVEKAVIFSGIAHNNSKSTSKHIPETG